MSNKLLKVVMHQYLDLMDRVKEVAAETNEHWQDVMAEVQAEREAERKARESAGQRPDEGSPAPSASVAPAPETASPSSPPPNEPTE